MPRCWGSCEPEDSASSLTAGLLFTLPQRLGKLAGSESPIHYSLANSCSQHRQLLKMLSKAHPTNPSSGRREGSAASQRRAEAWKLSPALQEVINLQALEQKGVSVGRYCWRVYWKAWATSSCQQFGLQNGGAIFGPGLNQASSKLNG